MEELQEADVLWPWTDTPPPSPEEEGTDGESYLMPAALPELYEHYDAAADDDEFSCEPFSGPPASSSSSLTSSAQWSDTGWSSDGFFLSGPSSSVVSAGPGLDDETEEFLEADVLWPDTADEAEDGAAEFWWRCCCRRVAEAAAACGEREGWRPLVSSPIDIPMATRGTAAARRRTSQLPAVLARRRR